MGLLIVLLAETCLLICLIHPMTTSPEEVLEGWLGLQAGLQAGVEVEVVLVGRLQLMLLHLAGVVVGPGAGLLAEDVEDVPKLLVPLQLQMKTMLLLLEMHLLLLGVQLLLLLVQLLLLYILHLHQSLPRHVVVI